MLVITSVRGQQYLGDCGSSLRRWCSPVSLSTVWIHLWIHAALGLQGSEVVEHAASLAGL